MSERPGPERPELPDQTLDDTDEGWGRAYDEDDDAAVRRLLAERPPHHDR